MKTSSSPCQFAIIDKNGSETIITPVLPAPFVRVSGGNYTTDGNTIFFKAYDGTIGGGDNSSLFTCDMNGGNVKNLNKSINGYSGDVMSIF